MSIYIRDLDAPKECNACDYTAYNVRNGMSYCRITGTTLARDFEVIDDGFKPEDCPIVQVPPHGDLIDRNKLYEKTAEWEAQALHMVEVTMNDEDTTEWKRWSTVLTERSAFKYDVADAPTVIPKSGGKEDE